MAKASTKSPKRAAAKPRKAKAKAATKAKAKAKRGRPAVKFDLADLEKLAGLHCTYAEVAAFFDCSEATVKRRMADDEKFRERFERGQGRGKISLRRSQARLSTTHPAMAIFLGKNYLGQSDKIIHEGGETPLKADVTVSRDPEHLTDLARRIAFILEGAARAKGKT